MVTLMYYDYELGEITVNNGRLECSEHARPYVERYRYRFSSDEEFVYHLPQLLGHGRVWAKASTPVPPTRQQPAAV